MMSTTPTSPQSTTCWSAVAVLVSIVLVAILLVTGCSSPFSWARPKDQSQEAVQAVDTPSFRTRTDSDSGQQSIFFNDKSKEIERSLGL